MSLEGRMQNDVIWTIGSNSSDINSCQSRDRNASSQTEVLCSIKTWPPRTLLSPVTRREGRAGGRAQRAGSFQGSPTTHHRSAASSHRPCSCLMLSQFTGRHKSARGPVHKHRRPCLPTDFQTLCTAGSFPTSAETQKEKEATGQAGMLG